MPDASDIATTDEGGSSAGVTEAVVVSAPFDETSTMTVQTSDGVERNRAPWMPRGESLPSTGDRCWVSISDAGVPVVVAWWPEDGDQL